MERIELAEGLAFSRLVYGMWRLADDGDTSVKHVDAKINAALDQGITTFDQADIYGGYTAEAVMGNALKANPSLRQHMEIVSKCDIVIDAGVIMMSCKFSSASTVSDTSFPWSIINSIPVLTFTLVKSSLISLLMEITLLLPSILLSISIPHDEMVVRNKKAVNLIFISLIFFFGKFIILFIFN